MKAFGYTHFGGPEVFEILEQPQPTLQTDHDILLKTLAVGLNNFERSQRAGDFGRGRLPIVPGRDVVGEVVEVGSAVTAFQSGDIVIGHGGPAYAQYVVIDSERAVKKPAVASLAEAVALVTPGITAYNAVTTFTHVKTGDTVFVNGATGGVGSLIVQVANQLGAHVIGSGSSHNQALLEALPLDEIGFYDQENLNDKFANRADIAINAALNGHNAELLRDVVRDGGSAASVGDETDFGSKHVTFEHIRPLNAGHDHEALTALATMLGNGQLNIPIFKTLPFTLAGVIEGHQLLETRHAPGRIVLVNDADGQ